MSLGDIKKWSFGEMTSNTDGKTSVTSTSGFIIVVVGTLSFLLGVLDRMFIYKSISFECLMSKQEICHKYKITRRYFA